MQKKKIFTTLAITALSIICLCACGGKKNAIDYQKLQELLENGQYDSAISMIQEFRNAEYLEANKDSLDEEMEDFLDSIEGTYTPNRLSVNNSDGYQKIVIDSDLTVTIDDETYPFEVIRNDNSENDNVKYYLEFKYDTPNGQSRTDRLNPYIDEHGYAFCNGFVRKHDLENDANNIYASYVGKYISIYGDEYPAVQINDDFTLTADGQSYPIEYVYDTYDSKFTFYVKGYDRYNGCAKADYYSDLYCTKDSLNFISLWSTYYRPDQLDYVDITAENLYDYFEWTDWYVADTDISRNAFDEITSIYFTRKLRLKDEYKEYCFVSGSTVATEFEYVANRYYKDSIFQYNLNTGNCVVTMGAPEIYTYWDEKGTFTVSYINSSYDYSGDTAVIADIYLMSDQVYCSIQEDTPFDGSTYTFTTDYNSAYNPDGLNMVRSKTTLAFIKKDLE